MPSRAAITRLIQTIRSALPNPSQGLPDEVFLFATTITPMINVDLLIRNEQGQTLLTWRDDRYYGRGWHIPGGIIRFQERITERLRAVARLELGAEIDFAARPMAINEFILPSLNERSHFISMLYECRLITPLDENRRHRTESAKIGVWNWFDRCPDDVLPVHERYSEYIGGDGSTECPA